MDGLIMEHVNKKVLVALKVGFSVTQSFRPQLQREGDSFIMDRIQEYEKR